MKKLFRRFCLSLSSFSPGLILFLFTIDIFPSQEELIFSFFKVIGLFLLMIFTSFFMLFLLKKQQSDDTAKIVSIQPVENEVIPTYLGLFVIVIGLGGLTLFYQIVILIFLFLIWLILMEKSYYFNLLWLFAYRYYKVSDPNGNIYIIYSKRKDFKEPGEFKKLIRIINFTFLEKD